MIPRSLHSCFEDEEFLLEGSAARERLLETLGRGESEHREALLIDPTLAAASELEREHMEFGASDVADVRAGVERARRMGRVESANLRRRGRVVAATLVVALTLGLIAWQVTPHADSSGSSGMVPTESRRMTHSSLETLNRPEARVYELAAEEFSVILVVDESFEL